MRESAQQGPTSSELDDGPPSLPDTTGDDLPIEQWLLTAARDAQQARWEWDEGGLTFLRCGPSFTAIRLPGDLIRAAAGSTDPAEIDPFLAEALRGAPVIGPHGLHSYYALVPPTAGLRWKHRDPECLAWGTWLAVPSVKRTAYQATDGYYWAVPVREPGELCDVDAVDALTRRGQERMGEAS